MLLLIANNINVLKYAVVILDVKFIKHFNYWRYMIT